MKIFGYKLTFLKSIGKQIMNKNQMQQMKTEHKKKYTPAMNARILLLLLLPTIAFAEGSAGFAGAFLRIGLGARGTAMGNAQVATADNGFGIYYNPAGISRLKNTQVSLSYSSMSLDRQFNYVGFSVPLPPFAGAAFGWINSGVGELVGYNSIGEVSGSIDNSLNAIYGSFSLNIIELIQMDGLAQNVRKDLLSFGIAVKYLRESISDPDAFDYTGKGFGFDFGLILQPHERLTIGYQLKDVNASLKSNTNDLFSRGIESPNKFPVSQKLGAYYHLPITGLSAAYDFEWNSKGTEKHHFGVEYLIGNAALRGGYDNDHVTLGGGLLFHPLNQSIVLDYAFVAPAVDEGSSHIFSWRFLF
jgi:hypothetical protein